MAAENNPLRTNHVKVRVDKTQQNSKCRLLEDRDENINYIISKCSKFAQNEYKTRNDWLGNVIPQNCGRNLNLTKRTNGICITQQLFWRMRHINSHGFLTYKRIT